MKIIFDSEEERQGTIDGLAGSCCPADFRAGLKEYCGKTEDCYICWQKSLSGISEVCEGGRTHEDN